MIGRVLFIFIRVVYVLIDVCGIITAIFLACWLRQAAFPLDLHTLFLDTQNPFYVVFLAWVVAILFFNGLNKLYETHRELVERHELAQLVKSVW